MKKPLILVSNDDGVRAEGIQALAKALTPLGRIVIVAPAEDQSTVSHAMSLRRPLRVEKAPDIQTPSGKIEVFAVDGTPTDSVYMAKKHLLKGQTIDLVVSGINHGANLGNDVLYSGTVSAAMEGLKEGIPSIAFSLVSNHSHNFDFASEFAMVLSKAVLEDPIPNGTFLNVNIPKRTTKKTFAVTTLGKHAYDETVEERADPRGKPYYWIGGGWSGFQDLPGTDCKAISEGVVSVTPVEIKLTSQRVLPVVEKLNVEGFQSRPDYLKASK